MKAKTERLSHCDNAACGTVKSAESVPSYSAVTSSWVTAGVAQCHGKQKKNTKGLLHFNGASGSNSAFC